MRTVLILLAVLVGIMLIPVGVSGGWHFDRAELKILIGPLRLRLLPRKAKKKPETAKKEKPKKKKTPKPEKEKPPFTFAVLMDYVRLGTGALNRLRIRLRVNELRIWYQAAADDPCRAAMAYGRANAAVNQLLALLHAALDIREQDVRLRVDFTETRPIFSVGGTVTIRIGQMLIIGVWALCGFVRIQIKQKKLLKLKSERTDENGEASHRRDDGNNDVEDKGNGGCEYHRGRANNNA
ncbi:MAG: hypothetical protein ACOX81_08340 [Candidatus Heteroscillospira sp.]